MEGSFVRKVVKNNGNEIEYYVSNKVNNNPTVIISMGIWEPAFRAFPLITRLTDIHCIVLSYRGRGGSESPSSGYDWHHHSSDLACVLENEPINNPIFMGFSKGVSYMLGYLSMNPDIPKGVIIIDYPAVHIKPQKGYAGIWNNMIYNGLRLGDYISTKALEGIEKESTEKEFYEDLSKMNCPVWIFRGTDVNSVTPSNLTNEDIIQYKSSIKKLEVIDFKYSGHMILDDELGKSSSIIKDILEKH